MIDFIHFSKTIFNLKAFLALSLLFLNSCGEVITTREYSTVITPVIGWKNIQNINASNITNFQLTGTCTQAAGTITVDVGNPMLISTNLPCVNSTFSASIDLSSVGLAQGPTELLATQSVVSASAVTNLIVDTIVPFAPLIVTPIGGSTLGSRIQTIDGTCENTATVNFSGDIVGTSASSVCIGGNFSQTITLTLGDGTKTIFATQQDPAGNVSPSDSVTIILDTTSPSVPLVPVITSPSNGVLTNSISQIVVGTCEVGATVNIAGSILGSPLSTTCPAGNYSLAVSLLIGDGLKTLSVNQTNVAGTSPTANVNLTLDTSAPLAPTITSPTNGSFTNLTAQTVTGACETGATVNISGDIVGSPVTATCVASAYSRAVTLTAAQGVKAISVTQTDLALNTSIATNISITLDTSVPLAPTITSPTNGSFTNLTAQTVTGACETGATVNITGNVVGAPINFICVGSTYSEPITLTAAQGAKTITVDQTDPAGNLSLSSSVTITYDNIAPIAPTITSPTNGSFTNSLGQTIVGGCETGATLNISGPILGSPVTTLCVASAYSRAVSLPIFSSEGLKTITVTQTDLASNTSLSTNVSYTYDYLLPTVVVSSTAVSPTAISPIPFTITFSESVTGFISADITVVNGTVTTFSGGPSVYSLLVTPTATGNVSVSVAASVAQDLASNNNTVSNTLVIDYQPGPLGNQFITEWDIPADSTAVSLPLQSGFIYNFTVDWGDGSPIATITSDTDPDISHTYLFAGSYTVTMTGVLQAYGLFSNPNCYIYEVVQMGYMDWRDLSWAFKDCISLQDINVNDGTEFSNVVSMRGMFYGSYDANPDVSLWDVSNVLYFDSMFQHASSADPDVSSWDVSSALDMSYMFYDAGSANPDTSGWNTSQVQNMSHIFYQAYDADPDTSGWDTSNVTNMSYMFYDAYNADPDTSGWDTSNVTDMSGMFYLAVIANPDTSGWDTSNVTDMNNMFAEASIANPDTSSWDTSNVTDMSGMFYLAVIANPDTSGWNTSQVTDMSYMFAEAYIANPSTSGWITSLVTDMSYMFQAATIADPDTSSWNTSNVTDMAHMFFEAENANPDTAGWNTSQVNNMAGMFYSAYNSDPDTSGWDTSQVTDMSRMFQGADSANPDTSSWDTSQVTNMMAMFSDANIVNPDTSGWNTSQVTDMSQMFEYTIANPDTSGWDTSQVTDMNSMFERARFANPDTSGWDTSQVTDMNEMFIGAEIANPNTSGWNTSQVVNMRDLFNGAESANPDTSGWDTSNVTNMSYMFAGAILANPNTTNWNTSQVTNMQGMFYYAYSANPDTSNWDTSQVTSMELMFCAAIVANPNTSNWDTSQVTNMLGMFLVATVANPDVSNWNTSQVLYMSQMFEQATIANPDTTNWSFASVLLFNGFMNNSGFSNTNYSILLQRLSATINLNSITLNAGPSKQFQPAAAAARANLIGVRSWTINDGGPE